MSVVEIEHIPAAEAYDLRARVLRDGDFAAAHVPDDDLPGAWHLGARCSGTLAGVASFYPRPSPLATNVPAVQLRFMAVEPAMHGHGIGRELQQPSSTIFMPRASTAQTARGQTAAFAELSERLARGPAAGCNSRRLVGCIAR
jgi:hypothetical protein